MKIRTMLALTMLTLNLHALTLGAVPKQLTISGENGGLVKDESAWDSSTLHGKVKILFYVDPDEKDLNNDLSAALKAEHFDKSKFGSIAIINLAATWKPNFIIESILKSKQEEFPHTLYIKDKTSVLVKEWHLSDDNSDILLFAPDGRLLFQKDGKLSVQEIQKVLQLIKENL